MPNITGLRRLWKWLLASSLLGALVWLVLTLGLDATNSGFSDRHVVQDTAKFRQVARLAQQMIQEGENGVTGEPPLRRITSFHAFFDYVALLHPEAVAHVDDANPFPGLLAEGTYGHPHGPISSPDELLFWSDTIHQKNVGAVQMRLTAGGVVRDLLPAAGGR